MAVETLYEHIVVEPDGVARIEGTRIRVIDLVLDRSAHGWSPEEIQFQFPHLTMGQIHAALAYYSDHRDELDADIEARLDRADQAWSQMHRSDFARRLRQKVTR